MLPELYQSHNHKTGISLDRTDEWIDSLVTGCTRISFNFSLEHTFCSYKEINTYYKIEDACILIMEQLLSGHLLKEGC